MGLPLNKRDFDVFLSHAHKDHEFVASLDDWLTEKAGLRVWYDARELSGGALLATDLQRAIERCRGILLIASTDSLNRGWVINEYNSAMDERSNDPGFRVVALRVGNADTTTLMKGTTWIDVPESGLDAAAASSVIRAFYPGEKRPNPASARDVYVSCSWRQSDGVSARAACQALVEQGFRLIGDARDQKGFGDGDRVRSIIASCGAFVCIIPFRGAEEARAAEKPYKYFLQETDLAKSLGLPTVVVADPRVRRIDGSDDDWRRMDTDSANCSTEIGDEFEDLWDEWRDPLKPHYVFCAMDLDSTAVRTTGPVRQIIERVTGMPTVIGSEIHEDPIHTAIIKKVRDAFLVVADITDDNINSCIEAGMGLAAGVNVEIMAKGRQRRPPFMLRSLQLSTFEDGAEQLGVINRIARPYRRRVINAEL